MKRILIAIVFAMLCGASGFAASLEDVAIVPYEVERGDCIWTISEKLLDMYNIFSNTMEINRLKNEIVILSGKDSVLDDGFVAPNPRDPDFIVPGEILYVPDLLTQISLSSSDGKVQEIDTHPINSSYVPSIPLDTSPGITDNSQIQRDSGKLTTNIDNANIEYSEMEVFNVLDDFLNLAIAFFAIAISVLLACIALECRRKPQYLLKILSK